MIICLRGFGYPNKNILSPIMIGLSNRGDPSEGNLSSILTIVEELIRHTTQAHNTLQSNFETAERKKNDTEGIYHTSKTNRLSACSVLNSSDVQRNVTNAIIIEDDANDTLTEKYQDYQDALQAHEKQNVEFEIESLHWIRNMVYRLLTGTHMPTTSPTLAPTPPPTLSPTIPALSNLIVRNHQRFHFGNNHLGRRRVVWIDKEDNIICLGSCGIDNKVFRPADNWPPLGKTLPSRDDLEYSWIKDGAFKEKPLFLTDRKKASTNWEKSFLMWGQVDVSSPDELKGKKPISLTTSDFEASLMVLFDDGSIWMKPSQQGSQKLLEWLWNAQMGPSPRQNTVTKLSGGIFPHQTVSPWLKTSGNTHFSRIYTKDIVHPGSQEKIPFAWDATQDLWVYFGLKIHPTKAFYPSFFSSCTQLETPVEDLDTNYTWDNPAGRDTDNSGTMEFVKFPRECYPGKGNIVDVRVNRFHIWLLFDGAGGNGNLWGRGGAGHYHSQFMDNNDPQYRESKRGKFRDWYQFGQNRRVTTFEVIPGNHWTGGTLFIATTDGVYCIGQNKNGLCSPKHDTGTHLNWTKVNTSSFTAPVRRMYYGSFDKDYKMTFFLKDGSIFVLDNYHRTARMTEYYKEITRTNEIVDFWVKGEDNLFASTQNVMLLNRSGSHYHKGEGPQTCDFSRDSNKQFNAVHRSFTLCGGVADDLGYIDDRVLYLT